MAFEIVEDFSEEDFKIILEQITAVCNKWHVMHSDRNRS